MDKTTDFVRERIQAEWRRFKASGGTQADAGARAGVDQAQISQWLRGARPTADAVVGLARGMGIPAFALLPPENGDLGELLGILVEFDKGEMLDLLHHAQGLRDVAAARRALEDSDNPVEDHALSPSLKRKQV